MTPDEMLDRLRRHSVNREVVTAVEALIAEVSDLKGKRTMKPEHEVWLRAYMAQLKDTGGMLPYRSPADVARQVLADFREAFPSADGEAKGVR